MARTIQENGVQAGQTDEKITFQADNTDRIDLPSTDFVADAHMVREGDDLVLETPAGETAVIEGYFSADPAPVLHAPDGSVLTPNLVQAFAHSPMEFAANETASDQSPVGAVEEVKGHATVTRSDGTVETITNGTPIYQGDVVETDAAGAVNIVFIDETSMSVSANARLAIDEYTYDPSTESGTTNFSVLRGLFVFTSGLIGRDDPDDVKIDTPVGSIGIRGTIIAGEIIPGGESNISVLEGAIVITNGAGEITLSEQFETVRLSGFDQPMKDMGVIPASEISMRFSSISDVNASLFTTIDDAVKEQTPAPEAPKMETAPEPTSSNEQTAPVQQNAAAPVPAPDVMAPIDSSVPSLDMTGSSGLPSTGTITGQTSTGLGTTATTTTSGAPAPAVSTAPAPAPSTTGTIDAETPATTTTQTQQPPPILGSGTTVPVLPFTVSGAPINDISTEDALVRTVDTGRAGTIYTLTGNPNGYYYLDTAGAGTGVNVKLTAAGAAALAASLDNVQLGDFQITATLGSDTNTRTFGVVVADANAGRTFSLDAVSTPGVTKISDNYEDISGNSNSFGYSITALGDVNNDGFDDFLVGKDSNLIGQNHVYKFGGQTTHLASGGIVAAGGATISVPITNGDHSETIVAGIGDFNGDGVEDYAIGQSLADSFMVGSGNAAIVSGANPSQKLVFNTGLTSSAEVGFSVDGVGDFNNDGYADAIIGAPGVDRAYYQGGHNTSWTGGLSTSGQVNGVTNSGFGTSLTGLGDFNGDGYSDFAVGAPAYDDGGQTDIGKVAVYGGNANANLTAINTYVGSGTGAAYGTDLFSLGDINGDGRTDLMIGDGKSGHIVLGTNIGGAGAATISFDIGAYELTGGGGIGDFNGDGYDDFTVSLGDTNGTHSYIVFGKDFAGGTYDLNFFKNPDNAIEFKYSGADKTSGLEISALGDINGDGYDDFAMGVPDANGALPGNGGVMVFYGRNTGDVTGGFTATANSQSLVGDAGSNFLNDGGFNDISLRGGAGSDIFRLSNTNFLGIDGGGNLHGGGSTNYDYIQVWQNGTNLDFSNVDFEKISGVEAIHYYDDNQTITLTMENIFNLLKTSDDGIFRIANDAGANSQLILKDDVGGDGYSGSTSTDIQSLLETHAGATTTYTGTTSESGKTYDTFKIGGYTLMIDQTLTVDAQ